jgi:tetrapyrrole methylase family protein/MazG family protein
MERFDELVRVMARLRAPGGCPWDREQTHRSLRRYLLEETYEAVEAIDDGDWRRLRDELGDVLLQVVFHAQLAAEREEFSIEDVVAGIVRKLYRRHPHVFGEAEVADSAEVLDRWEHLKHQEEGYEGRESLLDGVPRGLPALQRAMKLQSRASRVGFDWDDASGPWGKVHEELGELERARPEEAEAELGDVLFALVNLARFLEVDAEGALRRASNRFYRRFRAMERAAADRGGLAQMTLPEMDELWEQAKASTCSRASGDDPEDG